MAARFSGTLTTWNDDRGFGFIEADQGGQPVFVHIKAFPPGTGRPQLNQRLTFEVELGAEGKKRALHVEFVRVARAGRVRRSDSPARWGTASLVAIPAFLLVYAAAAILWRVPVWVAAVYGVASVVCFMAYALDKSAATAGRWRTQESTLLLLGLAGGWPGAIVAQQLLRHKTTKTSFRAAFWGTVVLNVAAFVALTSPYAKGLLR